MRTAALVNVACLSMEGAPRLAPLYRLLDRAADLLGWLLGLRYGRVVRLRGHAATRAALLEALAAAVADPRVEAVDLVIHAHGFDRMLFLADGPAPTSALATALPARGKLRLLYSTACHGASHAPDLREAGFRAVIGARAVNASGATEAPLLLALWAAGVPIGRALAAADRPLLRRAWDALARRVLVAAGAPGQVDSAKLLDGDGTLTVRT